LKKIDEDDLKMIEIKGKFSSLYWHDLHQNASLLTHRIFSARKRVWNFPILVHPFYNFLYK